MLKFHGDGVRRAVGVVDRVLVVRRSSRLRRGRARHEVHCDRLDDQDRRRRILSNKALPATAAIEGLKAWAATVNGEGGLQGHEVKIIVKDDGNDPAKSLTVVKQLVEQEGIVALTSWSGVDTSWAEYVEKQNVPVVGGQSYSPPWYESPVFFPVQSTLGTAMTAQPLMAKNAGANTIGSYYTADVAAAVEAVKAKDAIASSLGLKPNFNAAINSSQPDFTAPCLAGKKAGVDAMMLSGVPVERITPSCAQQGFSPMWILPGENVTAEVLKTPDLGDVLAPQMAFPFFIEDSTTKDYRSAMEANYRGPEDEMFSPLTSSAWMTGLVYEEVGKSSQCGGLGEVRRRLQGALPDQGSHRRRAARGPHLCEGRRAADRGLLLGDRA